MDAQQFLAEFRHVANAPNGIPKLREFVLVLAMQGRLVPQVPGEHADQLFKAIKKEKRESINAGLIRRPIPLPELERHEVPNPLPENWLWVRFGEIAIHNSGKTLDSVRNSGLPRDYITTSHLYWGRFDLTNVRKMLIREEELEKCTARKNDLLICEGGEAGRAAVWTADYEVCFQNHVHRARFFGSINPFFAYRFFEKLNATGEISAYRKGMGISNLSSKALAMIPFTLPPLEEQNRIVAKIDEFMALCNTLKKKQQTQRKLQNALKQSTLQAVAKAESPHELQASWARMQVNFSFLFSAPEDVAAFKGLVLDLAVNGRLISPSQRQASRGQEVLQAIAEARNNWAETVAGQEQKEALGMQKKLRTQRVAVNTDSLPEHWCWASILQVSQVLVDCQHKTAHYVTKGIHLVRTTDIRNGRMDLTKTKKISEETYAYWARRMSPQTGDIIFTREAPMGEAAIVPEGERVCLGQRTMLIRLFTEHFNNQYLLYVIMSPSFQTRMTEAAIGMTVKHLRVGDIEDLIVPVPPKQEQDQIVSCVKWLFEICDRYTDRLGKMRELSSIFTTNSMSQLTGISIQREKDEPVKVPQTELIANLRLGQAPSIKEQAPLANLLARHNGELSARDLWQRFGGEIDAFYTQLKSEVSHGWIQEPAVAEMREKPVATAEA